ncbi:DUF3307 domain-containing protein [Thalassotalea piscium]
MDLLLLLLAAHFIGDFYLQPNHWVDCRNKNHIKSHALWKHIGVHIALYILVFCLVNYSLLQAVLSIMVIATSHLITDYWKSYRTNNLLYFLIDQTIHIIVILSVWACLSDITLGQIHLFLINLITPKNMMIAMAYILVCKPASVIISLALKKHIEDIRNHQTNTSQTAIIESEHSSDNTLIDPLNTEKDSSTESSSQNKDLGLISAGAWIGYIERCLAISFLFMGQFTGIGFLVATKTIFRFGDLTKNKDMKLTEYMMLGTLLSYAIALFIGWNAMYLYKML